MLLLEIWMMRRKKVKLSKLEVLNLKHLAERHHNGTAEKYRLVMLSYPGELVCIFHYP